MVWSHGVHLALAAISLFVSATLVPLWPENKADWEASTKNSHSPLQFRRLGVLERLERVDCLPIGPIDRPLPEARAVRDLRPAETLKPEPEDLQDVSGLSWPGHDP
jgi:hypothetical protein